MASVLGSLAHSQVTRRKSSLTHGCSLSICLRMHPPYEPFPRLSESSAHCALLITLWFPLELELELVSSKDIVFKCSMFSLNLKRNSWWNDDKIIFPCSKDWPVPQSWQAGVKCERTLWEWPESNGSTFVHWENSRWQSIDCVHVCYVHTCMLRDRVGWGAGVGSCNRRSETRWTQPKRCRWSYKKEESSREKHYSRKARVAQRLRVLCISFCVFL